jgi:putative ABC transport system substrate-binding protein
MSPGSANISADLSGKRLELLREVVPGLARVAFLWNPDARGTVLDYKASEAAASLLHRELQSVEVASTADLDHFSGRDESTRTRVACARW